MLLEKDKTILITKDKKGNEEVKKCDNEASITMPVVVLTNGYSASASEILVGALKDNERATIVGTKTYGKGVIQEVDRLKIKQQSYIIFSVKNYNRRILYSK